MTGFDDAAISVVSRLDICFLPKRINSLLRSLRLDQVPEHLRTGRQNIARAEPRHRSVALDSLIGISEAPGLSNDLTGLNSGALYS